MENIYFTSIHVMIIQLSSKILLDLYFDGNTSQVKAALWKWPKFE